MVRVEADVHRLARQAFALEPRFDRGQLGASVNIVALNTSYHPAFGIELSLGCDHIVEAQPLRDFRGVEAVRRGRHHQPPTGSAISGNTGARARHDVGGKLAIGKAFHHRIEPLRSHAAADP